MGLLGVHNRVHFCHKYSSSRITYLSCISNTLIPSHNNSHSNLKYYNCSSRPMLALYSFLSNIFHFSLLLSRGILREVCVFAESRVHRHLILQTLQHLYPVRECHGMRLVWQKMHSAKRLRHFKVPALATISRPMQHTLKRKIFCSTFSGGIGASASIGRCHGSSTYSICPGQGFNCSLAVAGNCHLR